MGINSLAFPALGTGVGSFPLDECARIMIAEVLKYPAGKSGLKKVVFALFDGAAYQVFKKELDKQLARPA